MARPTSRYPTELELEYLKILWEGGRKTAGEVRTELGERGRELAHTSVLTTLNIMARKKYLKRKKERGAWVYEAGVGERDVTGGMLGDLVDRVFDGSATAVMSSLLETMELNGDEIRKLRRLINRKVKGNE